MDYDLPGKKFIKLLEKNSIEYVELKRPMLSEHSPEAPVIFPDGHLNAKGNRIFARSLQEKLETLGWVDA